MTVSTLSTAILPIASCSCNKNTAITPKIIASEGITVSVVQAKLNETLIIHYEADPGYKYNVDASYIKIGGKFIKDTDNYYIDEEEQLIYVKATAITSTDIEICLAVVEDVESISASGNYKNTYNEGETFDTTNLVITAKIGSTEKQVDLVKCTFSPSLDTKLTSDITKVTVTYVDKSVDLPITVNHEYTQKELWLIAYEKCYNNFQKIYEDPTKHLTFNQIQIDGWGSAIETTYGTTHFFPFNCQYGTDYYGNPSFILLTKCGISGESTIYSSWATTSPAAEWKEWFDEEEAKGTEFTYNIDPDGSVSYSYLYEGKQYTEKYNSDGYKVLEQYGDEIRTINFNPTTATRAEWLTEYAKYDAEYKTGNHAPVLSDITFVGYSDYATATLTDVTHDFGSDPKVSTATVTEVEEIAGGSYYEYNKLTAFFDEVETKGTEEIVYTIGKDCVTYRVFDKTSHDLTRLITLNNCGFLTERQYFDYGKFFSFTYENL